MNAIRRIVLVAIVMTATGSVGAQQGALDDELFGGETTLARSTLIEQVLARNPSIEAARQGWRAALERIPQVTSLEDPMVGVSIAPLSIGGDRFGAVVRGSQMIPFPGKLRLRGEMARAEAAAMAADVEMVRLELATMTSMLFDEWFVTHRALEITAHHMALMGDLKQSAASQYAVGRAAQQDPLQAEVEVAMQRRELALIESRREVLRAQLNALLHRRPGASIPPPPASLPIPVNPPGGREDLERIALDRRPALEAARARTLAGQSAVAMAELEFYPDFELMAEYSSMWMETEHQYMAGVSVRLPVRRDRLRAAVRESQARVESARQEELRIEDEIRLEIDRAFTESERLREVLEIFRDHLLPAAGDQLRAARAGFETGQNPFLAIVEAENNLRHISLEYAMTLAELYTRLAQLQRATGSLVSFASEGGRS